MAESHSVYSFFGEGERPSLETPISMNERRWHPREVCFVPVDYVIKDRVYKDFIENISTHGVMIETRELFYVGEELSMTFPFPFSEHHIKCAGEIAWADQRGVGVKFKFIKLRGKKLDFYDSRTGIKKSGVIKKEVRKEPGRVKKKKICWKPSTSAGVSKYRLYWSRFGEINYNSDYADLGHVTGAVLSDDIPSFPLTAGEIELGVTAISEAGDESDFARLTAYINFTVPDAPENIEVEDVL